MKIVYFGKDAVVQLNRMITSHYHQPHAVIAEANLEHYLEAAKHYGETIEDGEEKLLRKAAFLLYHLAFDCHAFSDGNKRTALFATATFLSLNSTAIVVENDEKELELAGMVKDAAEGKKSISAVCKWLRAHSKRFEDGN